MTFRQAMKVGVGLAVQAATTYATLILAGRILGAAAFGGLAALYVVVSSVATGLFLPLEQEVTRRRGTERETGQRDGTLLGRAASFGIVLCGLTLTGLLIAYGPMTRLLGGEPQLLAALCVGLLGYALCFVSRGELAGRQRLVRYSVQLSAEGTFRLAGLGLLVLLDIRSVAAIGWLFGLAPWVALVASVIGLRSVGRAADRGRKSQPLVAPLFLLLASTLAAQLLIGAGPVTAQLFGTAGNQARTGAFLAALVVVRVPVFLFTAVQPSVLPVMSAHVVSGRREAFRALLAKVLMVMLGVAILTTVVTTALGPWALTLLFGPDFFLSHGIFLLMGLSVGLFLASGVLSQAVIALAEHRYVTVAWVSGLVGLAIGTALGEDAVLKATMGLLVGAAAVQVSLIVLLWRALARWQPAPTPTATSMVADVA